MIRRIVTTSLFALLTSSAALADHPFILPSSTSLAGDDNVVTFDAAGSDHVFFFDHRPIPLTSISVTRPDGSASGPYNGLQGRFRSVFDLKLDLQGTWKVSSQQIMITGTFRQNGEERRVAPARGGRPGGEPGRVPPRTASNPPSGAASGPRRQPPVPFEDLPADATEVHLIEQVNRVETFVTQGAPTTIALKPIGRGLELDPVTHPNGVVAGETARFRFLVDGKPAGGLKVSVAPGGDRYRDDVGEMTLTTDSDGVVEVRWPAAGMYWLGAEAEDNKPSEKRAESRHMNYAATFEVMTP
ncbi:DUF4198 domain-containing protein [Sphingomonas oryzagri]